MKILNDEVLPGIIWQEEINQWLSESDFIIFLVSPDFIASDFIYDFEIKKSLERHLRKEVIITPIIIRPCDFESLMLSKFQFLPKNAKPVSIWKDRDMAWLHVVLHLKKITNSIIEEKIKLRQNSLPLCTNRLRKLKQIDQRKKTIKFTHFINIAAAVFILFVSSFLFSYKVLSISYNKQLFEKHFDQSACIA